MCATTETKTWRAINNNVIEMANMGKEKPSRRTRANISETAATRTSAAAKITRAAARDRTRRIQEVIRTLPRQNTRSTKDEIYNTKMIGALKEDRVPTYKVKIQQQGRENFWRAKEKETSQNTSASCNERCATLPTSQLLPSFGS